MRVVARLRDDLSRRERILVNREYAWTTGGAFVCLALSYVADSASLGELAIVSISVLAFIVRGRNPRLPAEVFAALVIAPILVRRWGERSSSA